MARCCAGPPLSLAYCHTVVPVEELSSWLKNNPDQGLRSETFPALHASTHVAEKNRTPLLGTLGHPYDRSLLRSGAGVVPRHA